MKLGQVRRNPFTVTGRLLFVATACCLFAVIDASLVPILGYLVWFLVVAFGLGLVFRPNLKVAVVPPRILYCGDRFHLAYKVLNTGFLPAYDLQIGCVGNTNGLSWKVVSSQVDALEAGTERVVQLEMRATKRGAYDLPAVQVSSLFPFGLFRYLKLYAVEGVLHVAPKIQSLRTVDAETDDDLAVEDLLGAAKNNSSMEYLGNREFQPGMQVRRWDFAAWARRGAPIVREYTELQDSQLIVMVDASRRKSGFDPHLEGALSAAASVIHHCQQQGTETMLLMAHEPDVPRQQTRENVEQMMERLAQEKGNKDLPEWDKVIDATFQRVPLHARVLLLTQENRFVADELAGGGNERLTIRRTRPLGSGR